MRTLLAVFATVTVAGAAMAAPVPDPTPKTFDVAHLIGDDGPFATPEDLRAVVAAFFIHARRSEGWVENKVEEGKLTVKGVEEDHRRVQQFLDSLHDLTRRRKATLTVEACAVEVPVGGGEKLLLPQQDNQPTPVTDKEMALTLRVMKAEKCGSVLAQPTMTLKHARPGSFSAGPYLREVRSDPNSVTPHYLSPTVTPTYQQKVLATVGERESEVTLKVTAEHAAGDLKPAVIHRGEFTVTMKMSEVKVVRLPAEKAAATELYLFVTAKPCVPEVGKNGPNDLPKVDIPPVPPVPPIILPTGGTEVEVPPPGLSPPVVLPMPPPVVFPAFGFSKPPEEPSPAAQLGQPSLTFTLLTRNPYFGTPWADKPARAKRGFFKTPVPNQQPRDF